MNADAVLSARYNDLKTSSSMMALQLFNGAGGMWEQFLTSGVALIGVAPTKKSGALTPMLFDREPLGKDYVKALNSGAAAVELVNLKRQSDILSSEQQAVAVRYNTRIRSMGAVLARRKSLALSDIEGQVREFTKAPPPVLK